MQKNTGNKRGLIVLVLAAIVVLAMAFVVNALLVPQFAEGHKTLQITVTHADGTVRNFEIETQAEVLSEALLEHGLIDGEQSAFGLFVTTVDGVYADINNQEWWHFARNRTDLAAGTDQTPIHNGDTIKITLKIGF